MVDDYTRSLSRYAERHLREILEGRQLPPRICDLVITVYLGAAVCEAAAQLVIAESTARSHLRVAYPKLRVRGQVAMVLKLSQALWCHYRGEDFDWDQPA